MADNIVEIIIGAKDTATPDLDALKARLDEIGRKVETAKVNVDGDQEAEARLLRLNATFEALGKKVERLKIKPDDAGFAKAGADILALDLAMDHLKEKTDKPGLFSRVFSALGGAVSKVNDGLGSMLSSVPLVGGAFESMGGIASAVLISLAIEAATLLGPLLAGLGLVTVGFGAFAAAAIPEISKVEKALTTTGAAGKKAWAALSPDEKTIGRGIDSLKDSFGKITKAVQPEVIQAFATTLKILKDLLPTLTPLAVAAGKALDTFLKGIDNWLHGESGKKFIEWMQTEGPKAIATFGHAMTDIVHGIGIVMYWWDRLGDDLLKFIKEWAPKVGISGQGMVTAFHQIVDAVNAVIHAWDNAMHAADNVIHAFGNVVHAGGNVVHAIGNIVNAVQGAVGWFDNLASAANSALGGIPGKILSGLGGIIPGLAAGGVVGSAATGGPRNGWTLVGEMGPELVRIPPGAQVLNNGQTAAMFGNGSGGGRVVIEVHPAGVSEFDRFMTNWLLNAVRVKGGGDVQTAFGTNH